MPSRPSRIPKPKPAGPCNKSQGGEHRWEAWGADGRFRRCLSCGLRTYAEWYFEAHLRIPRERKPRRRPAAINLSLF